MASLHDVCLDLAWSHWTALGVRGVFRAPEDAVDIEALLLFTATLRDADPRLVDEVIDWCVACGRDCVSISRLRRLYSRSSKDQQHAFSELAAAVRTHVDLRWPGSRVRAPQHQLSGKSRLRTPVTDPSLLQLRARRLLGTSARVEIVLAFVMAAQASLFTAADLAHLGFAKQNVALVLNDLVDAGACERVQSGNQHQYRLVERAAWRALFAPLPRSWPPWALRLPVLAALRTTLESVDGRPAIVQDVEVSKTLQHHLPAFRALGYADSGIPIKGYSSQGLADWAVVMLTGPTPGFQNV